MYRFHVSHPILVELLFLLISATLVMLECQFHEIIMHVHNMGHGLFMTFTGHPHLPSGGHVVYDIRSSA